MDKNKSIVQLLDYGKIEIHLKEILDAKGYTRNFLSEAAHTRFEVIDKWYDNNVERMDLDVLARFCYVLECKPEDILKYKQ